jgi:hypothetical protein
MNRDVARGQDIGKGGGCFESGADNVCVCYVSVLFVFILCLVYSMLSVHSQSPEVSTSLLEKKIFIIDDQHFSKFFLFFPLIFESSSDCGPFLICTSVFSQAPGSRFFFFIKISYLECMFNFRTPWHVLLLF